MVVVLQSFRSFNCFSTYFIFFKTWTTHWASPYKEPIYDMSFCLRSSVCCVEGYVQWGRRLEAGPVKITLNRHGPINHCHLPYTPYFSLLSTFKKGSTKTTCPAFNLDTLWCWAFSNEMSVLYTFLGIYDIVSGREYWRRTQYVSDPGH